MKLKDTDSIAKKFLKKVANDCIDYNIAFSMINDDQIPCKGSTCAGTFLDGDSLEIAVNKPSKMWLPVLVHEYNHMLQWKNKTKAWRKSESFKRKYPKIGLDAVTVFWNWMEKEGSKFISKKIIHESMVLTRDLELECEKMTAKLLKKLYKDYNIKKYIKQSNAYIQYYNFMFRTRKIWKFSPSDFGDLWKMCADYWLDDYDNIPEEYYKCAKLWTQ
jgi:hypothetical protein